MARATSCCYEMYKRLETLPCLPIQNRSALGPLHASTTYAIQWDSGSRKPPWCIVGVAEEVLDFDRMLQVSFSHVNSSVNSESDSLSSGELGFQV